MASWAPFAVVGAIFINCYDVYSQFKNRTGSDRAKTSVQEVVTSQIASTQVLIGYRIAVSLFCIVTLWIQILEHSLEKVVRYFTTWNFALLIVYFTLAAAVTWADWVFKKRDRQNKKLVNLCRFLVVSFHIIATTVWIVDLVTWFVLWPVLKHKLRDNPAMLAVERGKLFTFCSYIQHGVNAIFILGEISINNIGPDNTVSCWVCLWGLLYGFYAICFYLFTGRWLYPMLDATKATSPVFYLSMHGALRGCFFLFGPIKRSVDRLVCKPNKKIS